MGTIVVASDAEERWALVHELELELGNAYALEPARARLSHPAVKPADAVVMIIRDDIDLAWLFWFRAAATRNDIPIVALADGPEYVERSLGAGATQAHLLSSDDPGLVMRLRDGLDEVRTRDVVLVRADDELTG